MVEAEARKILVIEDEEAFRNTLAEILFEQGYLVVTAEDGAQGLEQVGQHKFDLIISDIAMPNVGGQEFINQLRKIEGYRNTPVVLISGKISKNRNNLDTKIYMLAKPARTQQILNLISVSIFHNGIKCAA